MQVTFEEVDEGLRIILNQESKIEKITISKKFILSKEYSIHEAKKMLPLLGKKNLKIINKIVSKINNYELYLKKTEKPEIIIFK